MTDKPHSRIPTPGATYRMKGSRKLYKFRTKGGEQSIAKPDEYRLDRHTKSGNYKPGHSSYMKKKTMSDRLKSGDMVRESLINSFEFTKRLATPFDRWVAYDTGVIDEEGNIIVTEDQRTQEQQDSFTNFDVLSLRLKKLLEHIPGGKTRLAAYAANLMIQKENWQEMTEQEIIHESNETFIEYLRLYKLDKYNRALEEMPTVNMGSGAIAGGGVNGPDDVKVAKKARKHYKQQNKEDASNYHMGIQAYVNQKFNGIM